MNVPPTDGTHVPVESLRTLTADIFKNVISEEHAQLIADLLIDTELRGVVSHGVTQVERYVRFFQEGGYNPQPEVRVLKEGPVTAALSGDGGIGMVVATRAMEMAIAKAADMGTAVTTSTFHGHLGSTGKYVRMALKRNMIAFCFSGRNAAPHYDRAGTIQGTVQGSPALAFGMPSGPDQPYFLLDIASHMPWDASLFKEMTVLLVRSLAIAHIGNIMSGTLGGQMLPEFDRRTSRFPQANQSGFYLVIDIERFVSLQAFKDDMDHLMKEMSQLKPLPGLTESTLPGGRAWRKEKQYLKEGIPIAAEAMKSLEGLAKEFDLPVPW